MSVCTTVERKRTWKNFPESHVLLKTHSVQGGSSAYISRERKKLLHDDDDVSSIMSSLM